MYSYLVNNKIIVTLFFWSALLAVVTTELTADEAFLRGVEHTMARVMMPPRLVAKLPAVMRDVQLVMDEHWPGTHVEQYGSTLSGIGFEHSDIDISIFPPNTSHVPNNDLVNEAVGLFRRRPQLFIDIQVPKALVHVIKGIHVPSGIPVDLTFNNIISLNNTQLHRYYLSLDKRALQLATLVKLWAKPHGVKIHQQFTNYDLIMLVIFFLQQKNILPTVAELQKNVPPYYVNGWNTAFNELPFVTQNNDTLYQLVGEFFNYYANFDYDKYVISILVGYPVEKKIYKDLNKLPKEFDLYKRNVKNKVSKPMDLEGVVIHDCFEPYLKAGHYLNVKQFDYAAKLFNVYNSTEFLKALISEVDLKKVLKYAKRKDYIKSTYLH